MKATTCQMCDGRGMLGVVLMEIYAQIWFDRLKKNPRIDRDLLMKASVQGGEKKYEFLSKCNSTLEAEEDRLIKMRRTNKTVDKREI